MSKYTKNDFEINQSLIVCHDLSAAERKQSFTRGIITSLGYKFITVDVEGEKVKFDYDLKDTSRFPTYIGYTSYKEFSDDVEYAEKFTKIESTIITSRHCKDIPIEKIRKIYEILVEE